MKSDTITERDAQREGRSEVRLTGSERAKIHSLYNLQVVPQNRNVCLLFKTEKYSLSLLKYEASADFLSVYTQWSSQRFYLLLYCSITSRDAQKQAQSLLGPWITTEHIQTTTACKTPTLSSTRPVHCILRVEAEKPGISQSRVEDYIAACPQDKQGVLPVGSPTKCHGLPG